MKLRPIIFRGDMVRAILAGTKTQTRRVMTPQPIEGGGTPVVGAHHPTVVRRGIEEPGPERWGASTEEQSWPCPYGQPGGRLWVREAWGSRSVLDAMDWHRGTMRDRTETPPGTVVDFRADYGPQQQEGCFWRPSIHMPRWASRLALEVTSVRVERVQAISEDDARAEGVSAGPSAALAETPIGVSAREAFAELWDSINGEREGCSWAANPWVWAVGFKVV